MRILVRTLPLRNANYGGILQAWALQMALRGLGHHAITDASVRSQSVRQQTKRRLGSLAHAHMPRAALTALRPNYYVNEPLHRFVQDQVSTVSLFGGWRRRALQSVVSQADAFLVGSDQVWRQAYGDVASYMLDFLREDDTRPRVAYAASMGSATLNSWGRAELAAMKHALLRFSAISVRERTAADWLQSTLGVHATVMPDPTLLLTREAYDTMVWEAGLPHRQSPYLLSYVLDENPLMTREIQRLSAQHSLPVVNLNGREHGQRRPIPEWLGLIRDATYVVTDSFHGTVFSALFNTDFAAVVNEGRGSDRFYELSCRLGIGHHIVADPTQLSFRATQSRAWTQVNDAIAVASRQGIEFLRMSLS